MGRERSQSIARNTGFFAETGLQRDDTFGGEHTIVGYECDGCEYALEDGLPVTQGGPMAPRRTLPSCVPLRRGGIQVIASGMSVGKKEGRGAAVMGLYTRGGTVFTAGTTDWSHGLKGGRDRRPRLRAMSSTG